jgi:hypothetical protein
MASRGISTLNQPARAVDVVDTTSGEKRLPEWILKVAKLLVEVGPELIELLCIVLA